MPFSDELLDHAVRRGGTAGALKVYSTTFSFADENPISEAGAWSYNLSQVIATPVATETLEGSRVAHGTQDGHAVPPGDYDDSHAIIRGFGLNYELEATIWKATSQSTGASVYKEFELRLREMDTLTTYSTAYGNTNEQGYEIAVAYDGSYFNMGRFKGAGLVTVGSLGVTPASGDKFRARIEGQRIRMWWNDVLKIDYTDDIYAGGIALGYPGIGFWANGAPSNEIGYSALTVTQLQP